MIKYFLGLLLLINCKNLMHSQTYTVGVPINQQFGWFVQTQTSSCYPGVTISCSFPYSTVTGVTNILIFDSVSTANSMYYNPGHKIINVGDTIFITPSSYQYDFYYPVTGKIKGGFFNVGTPLIAGQHYPCGYLTYMDFLVNCNDPINYEFHGTCTDSVLSGIENLNIVTECVIYPNPASTTVNLEFRIQNQNVIQNIEMQIIDVLGNCIKTPGINNFKESIDVSNLAKGVYFYNLIQNKQYYIKSGKIIIN